MGSKILVVGDVHIGIRREIDECIEKTLKFLKSLETDYVFFLGDIFHKRTIVNVKDLLFLRDLFSSWDVPIYIIVGNHDMLYKGNYIIDGSLNPTSLEMFSDLKNVSVIREPTLVTIDGRRIALYPYVEWENVKVDEIEWLDADIMMAHWALDSFYYMNSKFGRVKSKGLKAEKIRRYRRVLLGHFHQEQTRGHITYIGSLTHQTWSDIDQHKKVLQIDLEDFSEEEIILTPHQDLFFTSYEWAKENVPEGSRVNLLANEIPEEHPWDIISFKISKGASDEDKSQELEENENEDEKLIDPRSIAENILIEIIGKDRPDLVRGLVYGV